MADEQTNKQSPGKRLAAKKAAKAAQKAAKRGKQAEIVEQKVIQQAAQYGEWAQANRQKLVAAAALFCLILVGWYAADAYASDEAEAAAGLLWVATETSQAPIQAETGEDEASEGDEEEQESYATLIDRAEASIEAYDAVIEQHPGSVAAVWAQLGRGGALLDADRAEEAREAYNAALQDSTDTIVVWRALEGVAFAYEAEESWEEARTRFEELETTGDGFVASVAQYHLARLLIQEGETERAVDALREVSEELAEADRAAWPYVSDQVERRLAELDPEAAARSRTPTANPLGGGAGGQMDQAELQRRNQEYLRKQGQGADISVTTPGGEGAPDNEAAE